MDFSDVDTQYLRLIPIRMSSTINPTGNIYYAPPDRAESNPNLLISGFIDESPFAGPGTWLQ